MRRRVFVGLVCAAAVALSGTANAHSFNVLLLLPLTGPEGEAGRQMRKGFMLATRERDSHAGEESDGHLGGLDVYVSVLDTASGGQAEFPDPADGEGFAVVAALDPAAQAQLPRLLPGSSAAVLSARRTPFEQPNAGQPPEVAAFIEAYRREYGEAPSAEAAWGYDAARRIDAAVREGGGATDATDLQARLDRLQDALDP